MHIQSHWPDYATHKDLWEYHKVPPPDGVDTAELKKKTGFNDKKIHNIVYKLKKQKRIKSLRKGIYVST